MQTAGFKGRAMQVNESGGNPPADRQLAALRQRIARRFTTVTEIVAVGRYRTPFTRIVDPDDMAAHMEVVAGTAGQPVPSWQPYWAANWDAAWAVGQVLSDLPLEGRAVLDLGCGLGLTGIVAAIRGARVTMVDAAPPCLLFARLNTWPWRERVQIRRLDWRTDRLAPLGFELIVGSDIIYDCEDWPFLDHFWRQHLAWGGELLLGESGRRTGALFPDWLSARGWTVHRRELTVPQCPRPQRILAARLPAVFALRGTSR